MINPTTHAIAGFPIPTAFAEPGGITSGPDGNLWFTWAGQIGEVVIVPSITGVVSVTIRSRRSPRSFTPSTNP
jgi:streptogramin lyase